MFIMMLVHFFLGGGGVLCRAFIALGLRCYAYSLFSVGHIFFIFYYYYLYIFF
jgi:hypothetical protein